MLQRHGFDVTEDEFRQTFGRTNDDIFVHVYPSFRREDYPALGEEKESAYRDLIRDEFPAMDGASELIDALHSAGATLALGSSAPPENVAVVVQELPHSEKFVAATHGKEVKRGKPDPEVFLTSAKKIGIDPRHCVVVEDSPPGVAAGKAAGCKVIALLGTAPREELAIADKIVASLRDVTPQIVHSLLTQKNP